jgi:class 3 adenylate cyclase
MESYGDDVRDSSDSTAPKAAKRPIESRFRMDVIQEVVSVDREAGIVEFLVRPDPRRYEWRDGDDGRYLYDNFDQTIISEELVMEMLAQAVQIQPLSQPQTLGDAAAYVASRAGAIRTRLASEELDIAGADPATTALAELVGKRHEFVALVVDIKDSTKLARAVDVDVLARMVAVVSDELSVLLPSFHGHVLKYTGDGLIGFFPAPNFIRMNDHAVDCALTMRRLVYDGLNPAFKEWGLPPIEIRIGIEGGEGVVSMLGSATTKRSVDLIGDFISIASKLQAMAPPGGIYIGYITERNLHVGWRQQLNRVETPESWSFTDETGNPYPVFEAPIVRSD